SLEVVDGNLGPLPFFTALYALMEEQNRPRFEGMKLNFKALNRELELTGLELDSPLISFQGEGKMTMEGYLSVVLTTDSFLGRAADLFGVPIILKWLTSNLVRFHLFGH